MKQVRFRSRLVEAAAVFALLFAVPIGVLAHEHSTESQCLTCKVSGAETAVFSDGPALPAPESAAGLRTDGVQLVPDPPATAPGAPRAPPS
jgi:hypothetical protein